MKKQLFQLRWVLLLFVSTIFLMSCEERNEDFEEFQNLEQQSLVQNDIHDPYGTDGCIRPKLNFPKRNHAFMSDDISFVKQEQKMITPDIESINKLIQGMENTLVQMNSASKDLGEAEVTNILLEESELLGINLDNNPVFPEESNVIYSDEFNVFNSSIVEVDDFESKEEYVVYLSQMNILVLNSNISTEEKQLLVNRIAFMKTFVDWLDYLHSETSLIEELDLTKAGLFGNGWWNRWGKCVASTLGHAIAGGLGGGPLGALGGALIGAAKGC